MLVKAAIVYEGVVYTGIRHYQIIAKIRKVKNIPKHVPVPMRGHGFVNEAGKYFTKKEALIYAVKCGQLKSLESIISPPHLTSEDLWDKEGKLYSVI
jgi:hypothetical protein